MHGTTSPAQQANAGGHTCHAGSRPGHRPRWLTTIPVPARLELRCGYRLSPAIRKAALPTSEFACQGPEVDPLALVAHGTHGSIRRLGSALDPIGGQDAAAAA